MDASALAPLLARGLTALQAQVAALSASGSVEAVAGSARWTPAPDDPVALVVTMEVLRDGARGILTARVSATDQPVVVEGGEAITTTLAALLRRVESAEAESAVARQQAASAVRAAAQAESTAAGAATRADEAFALAMTAVTAAMDLGRQVSELADAIGAAP